MTRPPSDEPRYGARLNLSAACRLPVCRYEEPHDHGFACSPECPCHELRKAAVAAIADASEQPPVILRPTPSTIAFRVGYYVLGPILSVIALAFIVGVLVAFWNLLRSLGAAG